TRFALAAARQALEDGGLLDNPRIDPATIGVYLGSGEGGHDFKSLVESTARAIPANSNNVDNSLFFSYSRRTFNGRHEYEMEMHTTTGRLAEAFNLQGPNLTCQTAC